MIVSRCINCGEDKPCLKVEARAPLPEPVIRRNGRFLERIEYEIDGPMVEICRPCLAADGVLGAFLAGDDS